MSDLQIWLILALLVTGLIVRQVCYNRYVNNRAIRIKVDRLNAIKGGDWYYDISDKKYKDFMTDRECK